MTKFWLFAENEFNRHQDEINNYNYLGISENKLKKRNFNKGDLIFVYISKIKKFSDIREISSDNIINLPPNFSYDKKYDLAIQTKLVKKLNRENWIDSYPIFEKLELMKNNSIGFMLLNCPILLEEKDSNEIINAFNKLQF